MEFTLGALAFHLFAIITTLLIGWYTYFKWWFKYWERQGIPYVEPKFPFGTLNNPFWKPVSFGQRCADIYNSFKANGHKHVGLYIFASPKYMPIDLQIVKSIMQTDFDHFVDRGVYYNERDDPLSAHLFSLEGARWKNLRVKLTPTFTSGKLKMMFPTLLECGDQLKEAIDVAVGTGEAIDIKDFAARFTTNIIGSCAFGIECNCFKDANSDFRKYGKRVFQPERRDILRGFVEFSNPELAERLRLKLFPDDVSSFFMKVIRDTVTYREDNNVTRKDFMQLLIDIKNSVKDDRGNGKGLTFDELAAQAFIFFLAGYETSSTTMTFCLFELACNPDIQEKVRKEIEEVSNKHGGEITYEALAEMKYMGQVIDETLRKYPPLTFLNRKCLQPYNIPGTDLVLEKGTSVIISALGVQHDPEYFPNPDKFDPDRFSEENKHNIIPFTYMPFGEGPRICIGLRFGIMQTKMGLAVLLKNYKFSVNNKTKVPLEIDPFSFILSVKGDIWLNAEPIKK